MSEIFQEKQNSILEKVSLYDKEIQQKIYISMVQKINSSLQEEIIFQQKEILQELRETFLEKIYALAASSPSKILESQSPTILTFTAG